MTVYGRIAAALLAICGLSMTAESAGALEWPVQHRVLTATFGENRWDHFHDGIDIGGGAQAVHPAAPGEVIFTFDEGQDPRDLPTGLGSFMVIQHDPEFRTLYAHMRAGSVLQGRPQVTTSDVIGVIGDTGDSVGSHLHFEVIDHKSGEILNPLTLLPALSDTASPVIVSVSLQRSKKLIPLGQTSVVPEGEAGLVVDVYDPSQYVDYFDPMAPYEIDATLNGQELFDVTYDALKATGGKTYLAESDTLTFANYYVSTWGVRLGSVALKSGQAHLVITARDFAGNETVKSYNLSVRGGGSS